MLTIMVAMKASQVGSQLERKAHAAKKPK